MTSRLTLVQRRERNMLNVRQWRVKNKKKDKEQQESYRRSLGQKSKKRIMTDEERREKNKLNVRNWRKNNRDKDREQQRLCYLNRKLLKKFGNVV